MRRSDLIACLVVLAATAAFTWHEIGLSLARYRDLRSGWSWDLAYYNQWFWAFTKGDRQITVRPIADYATEGPSVWKTNYLAPIRYVLLPIYAVWPGPETLLIIHAILFWCVLPAAYALVRYETGSVIAGLIAVPLVWLTPLAAPLAANDFREIQLAVPFTIVAALGVRSRLKGLAIAGVAGLLACRQECAVLVASLAMIAPKQPEGVVRRYAWARTLWFTGLGWMLVVFFGFLALVWGWGTPKQYVHQFLGDKASLGDTLATAFDFLVVGLGSWVVLGAAAPRAALLTLPWVWGLSSGRWALRYVGTTQWHHVRYTAPFIAMGLAAGLLGGSRLWRFAARFPRPWAWRLGSAILVVAGLLLARAVLESRRAYVPYPIDRAEAADLRPWINRVAPTDGVLAHYDVTAPLSSRRILYSYVMDSNKPRGFPDRLPDTIHWIFCHEADISPEVLSRQRFVEVFRGPTIRVYRRVQAASQATTDRGT
jgi:hypothetical protein